MNDNNVTLKDILEICNRLEDKMDKRLSDVENDVEKLQGFQNKQLGILSVLSIFFSAIGNFIWNKINN